MSKVWNARRLEFDSADQALDHFYNSGWTDGLPVVPPTEEKVRLFLDTVSLPPQEVLGGIPERNRIFTAEKAAINAVMAGCLPEYFPVVVGAVRAMTQPAFGLHGVTATTGGAAVLLIVNGPRAGQLGLNSGQNVFGPGNRANAAIGRALRLILYNLGGREFDRGTLGHPGKYTYCIAEDEDSCWEPLQVSRGFSRETSTVTVFAGEGPNQVQNHGALKPESILLTLADRMRALGSFNMLGDTEGVVVICREHYQTLIQEGWDKARVRQFLFENAVRPLADLKRGGLLETPITPEDEKTPARAVSAPEHILLVLAGGVAGRFSAFIPGWGGRHMSSAVTGLIEAASCSGGV
ncbi:MAG: hypothetical protein HY892_19380 [Deltaproteobacteria bacterium]|nr:hypothetical protein [Deltaproteobacteria bacterium]